MTVLSILALLFFSDVDLLANGGKNLKSVNPQQARELVRRFQVINLSNCHKISEECLEILVSGTRHISINLNGLKDLSPEQAKILTKFRGEINLDGIDSVSPRILDILSMCGSVSLNGIRKVSSEQAEMLFNFKNIEMNGVEYFDKDSYDHLAVLKFCGLYRFKRLKNIDKKLLRRMSESGAHVELSGLSKLDKEMAIIVSSGHAKFILNGLDSVDDECFAILARPRDKGEVVVEIKNITKDQEFSYRKSSKKFRIDPVGEKLSEVFVESVMIRDEKIYLPKTTAISDKVAVMIGGFRFIDIDLPVLARITPVQAFWFGLGIGNLDLPGLSKIDNLSAQNLARHVGELNLGGLKTLTPEIAEALSRHVGELKLSGLEEMDDLCAKKLSGHIGKIYVSDYIKMSAMADEYIKNTKDPRLGDVFEGSSLLSKIKYSIIVFIDILAHFGPFI